MASAADISIEQFAPQSSVLVFSHPGAEQIIQRLDGSPMMKMLSGEGEMSEMEFMDLDEVLDRGAGPMARHQRVKLARGRYWACCHIYHCVLLA